MVKIPKSKGMFAYNLIPQVKLQRLWSNHILTIYITNRGAFPEYFRKFRVKNIPTSCPMRNEARPSDSEHYLLHCES